MAPPMVSVVLPTYDRPDRLREAVESVRAQTYPNVELVVVDDHSPTPAETVLEAIEPGSMTVRVRRHETNRGANKARNTGIDASDGTYLCFLDDDDRWHPKKVAKQVAAFERAGDRVGVVYTGTKYVYDSYERTVTFTLGGDVTEQLCRGRSIGEFSTLMVDADVIEESGAVDARFPSWQDREWLLRLSTVCEFEPVPEPLTVRRRLSGEASITDDFEAKRDVSYPLFLEKHRDLAATYGCERALVGALSWNLGTAALKNGYYADARRYLLKSLYYEPLDRSHWLYALVAVGGEYTYGPTSALARTFHRLSAAPIEK